jgi:hypothetical protein
MHGGEQGVKRRRCLSGVAIVGAAALGYDRATLSEEACMARRIALVLVVVAVVLVMAWFRVMMDGRTARQRADQLLAQGKADEAIGFYDRALHMYWPGSPAVARAVDALTTLAAQREASGDREGALHAWRVLRSGLYAARGLYLPYPQVVAQTEARIAELTAQKLNDPAEQERQLRFLQQSHDPHRGWSMLALAGFALWVGAAVGFIWRAMTPQGRLVVKPALRWAALFVAGYGLWLTGLYLA